MGSEGFIKSQSIVYELRKAGIKADADTVGRSVKAQMKYANKIGSAFSMILGDNELTEGKAKLKNMKSGEETEIALDSSFIDNFANIHTADMLASEF